MHCIPLADTPNDGRDHRLYQHANGLRCLLISDPCASLATCVAQVDAGSHDEPANQPGLAHLLEHMLFMGSERYPQPGSFPALVSRCAGRFNASTAAEATRFFFSVSPAGLPSCIAQLADMLAAPLFAPDLVGVERQVIDAEFHTRLADDALHQQAALATVLNPEHPMSRFSAGNAISLTGSDSALALQLRHFHQQHYRAADMLLILHANQSPRALLALATAFADRQSPGRRPERTRPRLFAEHKLPCRLQREAVHSAPKWQMVYPLTGLDWLAHDSTGSWLCEWIASPSPAGALGWLRERGLVAELNVRIDDLSDTQGLLCVELEPLLKLKDYRQLLDAWQMWLNWLGDADPQCWPTESRTRLLDQAFSRGPQGDPVEWLKVLAHRLMRLPVEALFEPSANRQPVSVQRWRSLLGQLQPARLLLVQPHCHTRWTGRTEWTGTGYQSQGLRWRVPVQKAPLRSADGPHFDFPVPISDSPEAFPDLPGLRLLELPPQNSEAGPASQQLQTRLTWCWPAGQSTEAQRFFLQSCWALQIESLARRAELCGVNIAWQQGPGVLNLTLSGPSDGAGDPLLSILRSVLSAITQRPTQPLLDLACHRLHSWQAEQAAQLPAYRCLAVLDTLLVSENAELCTCLAAACPGGCIGSSDRMSTATALSLWRYLREQAQLLWLKPSVWPDSTLDSQLLVAGFPGLKRCFGWVETGSRVLSEGIELRSVSVLAPDRSQLLYCQARSASAPDRAGWRLLQQLLASPFFDSLRTRQQLGYWVVARYHPVSGWPGLLFLVQSPSHDQGQITAAVDQFLLEQQQWVAAIPFADVKAQAERLADVLEARQNSTEDAFESHWHSLLGRTDASLLAECEALRYMQPEQWQALQQQLWKRPARLRLISETPPKVAKNPHLPKHETGRAL
ncbi:insulinase family protein [Halopseudomonas pelagia]|uniref:insulinase family protein n=1 Tax=Halopseudomonas pelagia TaxID=553151 RepID=UPI0030DCEA98